LLALGVLVVGEIAAAPNLSEAARTQSVGKAPNTGGPSTPGEVAGWDIDLRPDGHGFIHRATPFGNAQSLTDDELDTVAAYALFLDDVTKREDFELSERNFRTIRLPNEADFLENNRVTAEKAFWRKSPCLANCAPSELTARATALDVTPEPGDGPKVE
jgi:hypothetical protein